MGSVVLTKISDLGSIRGLKICLPSYANICEGMINEKNMRDSRSIFGVQQ